MAVKPSESKALIPAANTPICPKVIRLFIEHPTITDRIVSEIWNEDGTVTDAFKAAIGLTVGGLAAPSNVVATDGTSTTVVTVTWSPSEGAISYTVWRNTVNDSATATQVGSPSATTFDDASGTLGQVYFYFVKAVNAGGVSAFSLGDSGYRGTAASTAIDIDATRDWVVPVGVTTIAVQVWGGGGSGGGQTSPFCPAGAGYGGGGGGSGGWRSITAIPVTPGETLTVTVGQGGTAPSSSATNGNNGTPSAITRVSSGALLVASYGGNGGNWPAGCVAAAGGSGGSAGSNTVGTLASSSAGNAGGTSSLSTGGTAGAAVNGYGAGGVGYGPAVATAGSVGHVLITPNG